MQTSWIADQAFVLLITVIFLVLSGGWTVMLGTTARMGRAIICSTLFIFLTSESMLVHKPLTQITGFENAWIVLSLVSLAVSIALYRYLRERSAKKNEVLDESE